MHDPLRVHLVQPDIAWHDVATNLDRVRRMLDRHPPAAGSLIVLPEMFSTGFTSNVEAAADADGVTAAWMTGLAAELSCGIVGGLVTLDPLTGLGLNQALVTLPDEGEVGRYTKINRFVIGGELDHYAAGEEVTAFDFAGVSVCPLICYDLRFPGTWRRAVGSEVFVCIANWPAARMHHWHALLRARAIENQAFVVGVNRTGTDPHVQYTGGSVVYDFDGRCLAEMDERPGVASTELDLPALDRFRRKLPFLPKRAHSGLLV
jgi:predicted amidohydrolase